MSKKAKLKLSDGLIIHLPSINVGIDKHGDLHETSTCDGVVASEGMYLQRSEAIQVMNEHEAMKKNEAELQKLKSKHTEIEERIVDLEGEIDDYLSQTQGGSEIIHEGDTIRVGCRTVDIKLARKIVGILKKMKVKKR